MTREKEVRMKERREKKKEGRVEMERRRDSRSCQLFIVLMCAVFVAVMFSLPSISAYVQTNMYTPTSGFLGGFVGTTPEQFDRSMCQAGQDFVLQIAPFGCTPAVVRSDLLEDQSVPVFCQLSATKLNPLIDVNYINYINVQQKGSSPYVSTVGYQPASAALNVQSGNLKSNLLNNMGYAVILLSREPNESAMPDYVEGNLTATIGYDIKNAFGIGATTYYLPLISDESVWQGTYSLYGFWHGKGFLRATSINSNGASISLYAGTPAFSSGQGSSPQRISSVDLDLNKMKTSNEIQIPRFDFCYANMKITLDGIVNPDKKAKLDVDGEVVQAGEGESFMNGKCRVSSINKVGISESVDVNCQEDGNTGFLGLGSTTSFSLSISPKINFSIGKDYKDVGIGDYLFDSLGSDGKTNGYVYAGYIGSERDTSRPEDLFIYLVKLDHKEAKLSSAELQDAATLGGYYTDVTPSGLLSLDQLKTGGKGILRIGKTITDKIFKSTSYSLLRYKDNIQDAFGVKVEINGFSEPVDAKLDKATQDYYDAANADYDQIIQNYRQENYNNQQVSAQAFINKIDLADSLSQKRTMLLLCQEFVKNYPSADQTVISDCGDKLKLSNSQSSSRYVQINGKTQKISFDGVYFPSYDEYGVGVRVDSPDGISETFYFEKDQTLSISTSSGESIQLKDILDETHAVFLMNVKNAGNLFNSKETLQKGVTTSLGAYKFTLIDLKIQKVAKVSVEPNINYANTEVTFKFKIGIEKRGIQLSPEKTQSRIDSLTKQINQFNSISDKLGTTIQGLKATCLATEGLFTFENFLSGIGGDGLARTKVMRDPGGWNDKCADLLKSQPTKYSSLQDCLSENSKQIDADVSRYSSEISAQNTKFQNLEEGITNSGGFFGSDTVDTKALIGRYAPIVQTDLGGLVSSGVIGKSFANPASSSGSALDMSKVVNTYLSTSNSDNYQTEDLREIDFYTNILKQTPSDSAAKQKLYSLLSKLDSNSQQQAATTSVAANYQVSPDKISVLDVSTNVKASPYTGLTYGNIQGSTKILLPVVPPLAPSEIPSATPVAIVQTRPDGKNYIVVLHSSGKNYYINETSDGKSLMIYDTLGNLAFASREGIPSQLKSIYFELYDVTTYQNIYDNPEVKYYETDPYKGYPAIVPFDKTNGWYAATTQTISVLSNIGSYDKSGKVSSFWLCNVGADKKEEFFSSNRDDKCQLINTQEKQTFTQFAGLSESQATTLVGKAIVAIESAQTAYAAGVKTVTIDGVVYNVGEPASNVPDMQCTDVMSPTQCQILFNVCDPVICPSSRCNLGGQYTVRDVIQTGVIGGVAMCLPNIKEGIVIPLCLTGIQAGLDNYNSILASYRNCLQENLDTGKTTGICDEINSVYQCEFFWRQGLPVAQLAVPKLLSATLGQNVHGGGEYLSVSNAWTNAQNSINYFTQYYAANSYAAFKSRSLEEAGTPLCKSYVSAVYPSGGNVIDSLTKPDSPPQFTGWFDEVPFTTATNPPLSQYKVFYHIYAGKDAGAYYRVYLKGIPGSSFYQDTSVNRIVASDYIKAGNFSTGTVDLNAPSGYTTLCITVNGDERCDFKKVSTDLAVTYINDQYLSQQASQTDITSESSCVSGTASVYNFLSPNAESAANSLINPSIYQSGIVRICATDNPGKGTDSNYGKDGQRWISVGYCTDKSVTCWLDTQSVKDSIKIAGVESGTLQDLNVQQQKALAGQDYDAQFAQTVSDINAKKDNSEKVNLITSVFGNFFFNQQKAYLLLLRGDAFNALAKAAWNVFLKSTPTGASSTFCVKLADGTNYDVTSLLSADTATLTKWCNEHGGDVVCVKEVDPVTSVATGKYNGFGSMFDCSGAAAQTPTEAVQQQSQEITNIKNSPDSIFEFDSGGFMGVIKSKIYYSYSGSNWYWSIDNQTWYDAAAAAFSGRQTNLGQSTAVQLIPQISSEDQSLTVSLNGMSPSEGVSALMTRTQKNSEGGFLSDVLLIKSNVQFSPDRTFKVIQAENPRFVIYLKYDDAARAWKWSFDKGTWADISSTTINGQQPVQANLDLIKKLQEQGKAYLDGVSIIFGFDVSSLPSPNGPTLPLPTLIDSRFADTSLFSRLNTYSSLITTAAKRYGFSENLIKAMIIQESYAKTDVTDNRGSWGLMQVSAVAAQDVKDYYADAEHNVLYAQFTQNPPDSYQIPSANVNMGTAYLKRLASYYSDKGNTGEDIQKISLAAYNCGMGNIQKVCTTEKWNSCTLQGFVQYCSSNDVLQYVSNILAYEQKLNSK